MILWEILVSIVTIIYFFIIPIKIAFFQELEEREDDKLPTLYPGYFFNIFTIFVCFIIGVDILLGFIRCYYELGIAVTNRKKIVIHYLKGLFISDIIVWTFLLIDYTYLGVFFPWVSLIFYLRVINLSLFD